MNWPDAPVIVWMSGGKDSAVVLWLVWRALGPERVIPMHLALVPGMQCIEAPIRVQLQRVGVTRPLIVLTHPDALRMHAEGTLSLGAGTGGSVSTGLLEMAGLARRRAQEPNAWCASGEKRIDSLARAGRFAKPGSNVSRETRWLYPVAFWSNETIRAVVRTQRMPLAPTWGQTGGSSGFQIDANCMQRLKRDWPGDYERVLRAFPMADVLETRAWQRE